MQKVILFFILIVCFLQPVMATHNRAGEITYKQISDYTFEFTVITFTNTKITSQGVRPADRPQLNIEWGDGTYSTMNRVVYYDLPDYYRKNIYKAVHTYAGASTYEILVEDPNRNEGVVNIPNSINTVFSIKTILQINPALGFNNTPILLNPPVDKAAVNQVFIHNPAAYDPDGDSLSYEMTTCTGENGDPIPNYTFPESSHKPIYIDAITGNLVWDAPVKPGAYNVAFDIFEWRHGIKIGRVTRDMQIEVFDTKNTPPVFDEVLPVCVVAGDRVMFDVIARDSSYETITMEATGGVFAVDTPAVFSSTPQKAVVTGTFIWNTECFHVREQPYQVVFKATDDNTEVNLVDQISVDITVVGKAPENLKLEPSNNTMLLTWNDYGCSYSNGFNIYRSTKPYGFTPDKCETGVPAYTGFELVATLTDNTATSYLDDNNGDGLNQGYKYCYMITALYDKGVESIASDEVCAELVRGTPIITNVSVIKHDDKNGKIYVAWSKPIDFDTVAYPGNRFYILKRADGIRGYNYVTVDTLFSFDSDTTYIDSGLNTFAQGYNYKVEIHNSDGLTELPMVASSIFPVIYGSDRTISVVFTQNTPWTNYEYTVYRKSPENYSFDSIGVTTDDAYVDTGLVNLMEYCYAVKSYGSYDLTGIIKPIINYSHRNCGMPIDTIPPKPPVLSVETDCEYFINKLSWTIEEPYEDISKYYIYGALSFDADWKLIDSVLYSDTLHYNHVLGEVLAGCYTVTAVDVNFNESDFSNVVCVDNCEYYKLPNVFTPNGDGENDLFIPITPRPVIDRYIDKVDMKIYSRWGNLVFETTNPYINWDGVSSESGRLITPGVYYYVCDVYEKRISGIEHRALTGFVHVFYEEGNTGNNND